uniref:Thioredoxin domain-containing protein 11-like n=1 Tax=Dermatophagoides pteronyssinus TaxID=6956 RepID=A0A6P6YI63_DERPT|nr:thioredoxin domain-containing protein 11-like [Dermatophagoides pteronyssinus]
MTSNNDDDVDDQSDDDNDEISMDSNNNNDDNSNLNQQQQELNENIALEENKIDLQVNIHIRKKSSPNNNNNLLSTTNGMTMVATNLPSSQRLSIRLLIKNLLSKKILFPLILLLSIAALVLLHNGSLNTRKTPIPKKIFSSNNPFLVEFEFGQLKELSGRILQTEIAFIMFYAPWDSDSIRASSEIEIVANHYGGRQIFFAAINCWWPDGECRRYQTIRRYPHFVAHIRNEGEIEYKGPVLASYIIPFLDNIMNPLIPVQNEGQLLDLRSKHDAVVLGYFDFNQSPSSSNGQQIPQGYRAYLSTSIKALSTDPWRSQVVFTVVTNSRTAMKLKIDPKLAQQSSLLIIYVGNRSEHFTAKFSKPFTLLSWIRSRSELARNIRWMNPSGVKSTLLSDYIGKTPTFILFTPRSFLLGISPYYDLLREIVLDYNNCDNSPMIRSLIHRNILTRRLLEERLSELEERCHELLDSKTDQDRDAATANESLKKMKNKFQDNVDTCCHSQMIRWRSFGGVRHGMTKKCLCTSCVHVYLPKCPARCQNFDCFSIASRYLDEFDPNYVNNSAQHCNQIQDVYQPKYTPYYKIETVCSGNLQESSNRYDSDNDNPEWSTIGKQQQQWQTDEKINHMIKEFEIEHCRKLKLGMNYTDLNFPTETFEKSQSSTINQRQKNFLANFTGLACQTNRTLKFMAFDSLIYAGFAESLGVDVFNVPHSTVAMIIEPESESVYLLDHEILFDDIELHNVDSKSKAETITVPRNSYSKMAFIQFIRNFTDGKLSRFYRNHRPRSSGFCNDLQQQMIIEQNGSKIVCVPELNSMTFLSLITGKSPGLERKNDRKFLDKDIVVMFYAPWCGFCSSIAHVYLDVARIFDFSDDIIFSRINGDSNDLPWEYTVDRYPTIIFFPARKRSNSVTYPPSKPVDRSGLFEFIVNNAQLSVRLRMSVALCQRSCLKRSYQTNYWQRQKSSRWISSTLNSLSFIQDEIRKLDGKIRQTAKDSAKLKRLQVKQSELKQFQHLICRRLRQQYRIKWKQILLSQFILIKIDHIHRYHFDFEYLNRQLQSLMTTPKHQSSNKIIKHRRSNVTKSTGLPKLTIKRRRKDEL